MDKITIIGENCKVIYQNIDGEETHAPIVSKSTADEIADKIIKEIETKVYE